MIDEILNNYGKLGVIALKESVQKVSATHNTENSIRYEVTKTADLYTLAYYARAFFSAMETGRGPRKSTTYGDFDTSMEDYMRARGIGNDLSEKKFKQLAKFLTYKINKEGDTTYKKGGRVVYSPIITKLIAEIKRAVTHDLIHSTITRIKNGFSPNTAPGGNSK
jgi:hypothetical protein